ncbi:MAG: TspO/MBR family protein [Devosia sp.]
MTATGTISYRSVRTWITLAVFLVVVIGVGGLIGTSSIPGTWYEGLAKPPFNPPNWVFGPAWGTLYVMIAVAGWRIWMLAPSSTAMKLWFAQMIFNFTWSPIWFIGQLLWPAFAVIIVILALIVGFILAARKTDMIATWLFLPYLGWVAFASLLNLSIAILN